MNVTRRLVLLVGMLITQPLWSASVTITFDGINTDLQQHVLTYLTLAAKQDGDELLPSRVQRLHARAEQEIKTALQVFGFYKAEVSG